MTITIVCDILGEENNGTTIACMNLIRFLRAQGHTVRVVCADQDKAGNECFYVVPELNLYLLNPIVERNGVTLPRVDRSLLEDAIRDCDVVHTTFVLQLSHTAVKIAPVYSGVAVHSANASRNSQILAQLLGPDGDLYADKVKADQQVLREEYARRLRERDLIPIAEARAARRGAAQHEPVVPLHTGRMVFPDFDVADAEPYIDWSFFFAAWGLKGRYPEILDHPEKGAEARKVFADAQALLARIRDERLLTLQGVAGIFPARSEGDDILVTDAKGREKRLPMLRNQTRGEENLSLADFIAPDGDWIGCFALTAGIGLKELAEKFRAGGDDYSAIMAKLLADRLTEAFAEAVHAFMRREMWGYETGTPPTPEQAVRGQYRGRRMAFGYPASPDHSLKREVFDLLAVEVTTGMRLTENWMIDPGEALCGLMFSDADYFSVGTIGAEQLLDYARRRGMEAETVKKIIPNNV